MYLEDNAFSIFTDGSSYSSPRKGGMGMIFVEIDELGEERVEEFPPDPGYMGATNNQMELQACIVALHTALKRDVSRYSKIIIYTDSRYVVDNLQKATFLWPKLKWYRESGQPVLNADQWKDLTKAISKIYGKYHKTVRIEWVKSHSKNEYNKAVDKMAKQSAKIPSSRKLSVTKVRRKKFKSEKVEPGCVNVNGQRMSVCIVTDEFLREQKLYRYRYQVISKNSKYYKKIDFIYSSILLSAGHWYYIRVNKNNNFPQITKVFHEIERKI